VTVVIACRNGERWIMECLDSLLGQTQPAEEIILVDDESNDRTTEVVRSERRFDVVTILPLERNQGASNARNIGAAASKGDIVVFLDADDVLAPEQLRHVRDAFGRVPGLGLYSCDAWSVDARGEKVTSETWQEVQSRLRGYPVGTGLRDLPGLFEFSNSFPGFGLDRALLLELGGFAQNMFPLDDYDLALRVAESGRGVFYDHEPLALYRVHDLNHSGRKNAYKVAIAKLHVLEALLVRQPQLRSLPGYGKRMSGIHLERAYASWERSYHREAVTALLASLLLEPGRALEIGRLFARRQLRALAARGGRTATG
jgi:glycosyltransferase involved in cell wall biosynthesis